MNPVRNLNMYRFEIDSLAIIFIVLFNLKQSLEEFLTG